MRADYEPFAVFDLAVLHCPPPADRSLPKAAPQVIVRFASNDGHDEHAAGNGVFAVLPAAGGVSAVI
nr:hypothetical protein [Accumulibacter sp.]